MPQRMLSYQIRIWDRFRKEHPEDWLPPVLAVLVSHAPGGWTAARAFEDLFDPAVMAIPGLRPLVPRCAMIALDLAELSDESLQARALPRSSGSRSGCSATPATPSACSPASRPAPGDRRGRTGPDRT